MFKVGDKVRCVKEHRALTVGREYKVEIIQNNPDTSKQMLLWDVNHWFDYDTELLELIEEAKGIKYDQAKLRFDLIPPECEAMIAAVLTMGSLKYSANNWKNIDDIPTRYFNASARHMNQKRMGDLYDQDSGLLHTAHSIVSQIFILYKEIEENIGKENVLKFIDEKMELIRIKYNK